MTLKERLNSTFQIDQPALKSLTIVQVAPGGTIPPHPHAEGYVVVPLSEASVERSTHDGGTVVSTEKVQMLPLSPYFVEATKPGRPISLKNTSSGVTSFQKMVPQPPITGPQGPLPTIQIAVLGKSSFTVELALTLIQQAVGLMFRPQLPAGHGMLFLFFSPLQVAMYMRNVVMPLDFIFIDDSLKIVQIKENAPANDCTPIPSIGKVRAVLEVPAGTVAQYNIAIGDLVV